MKLIPHADKNFSTGQNYQFIIIHVIILKLLGGIPPIPTDVITHGPSVCLSVIFVHPAKATAQNEMPFGRDIRVVQVTLY